MRGILSVVALAAVLATAGCGQKTAEFIAEKAIETSSGGKVDVDISKGGAAVSMKTADGVEVEYGGASAIPEDFPKDVPTYPGLTVQSTARNAENEMFTYSGSTPDAYGVVADHFVSQLKKQGWAEDSAVTSQNMRMVSYKKDGRIANVQVVGMDEQSQVIVTTMKEAQ